MSTTHREGDSGRPPDARTTGQRAATPDTTKALYAEFTVKPGRQTRVAEMMRQLAEHVRREPGNLTFERCAAGCAMRLSHLTLDLEGWYSGDYRSRVGRMFSPHTAVPTDTGTVTTSNGPGDVTSRAQAVGGDESPPGSDVPDGAFAVSAGQANL